MLELMNSSTSRAAGWLTAYYAATPLFALADWLGANVRAAGLSGHPEWRVVYYIACLVVGALIVARPTWSAALSLIEASTNLLLLMLAVLLPYYDAVSTLAGGGSPALPPTTPQFIVNFLISGGVWVTQFHRARLDLR